MVKVIKDGDGQRDRSPAGLFTAFRRLYHRQLAQRGEEPRSKGIHVPVTKVVGPNGAAITFSMVVADAAALRGATVHPTCAQCKWEPVLSPDGQQVVRPAGVTRAGRAIPARPLSRVVAHNNCFASWLQAATTAGQLTSHPARFGVQVYLAGEAPERADSTAFAGSLEALGL